MSGSLNKVLLIGNMGRDPELKMTPSGQQLARFSVATTDNWKNAQGEKQTKTEWHNIVVFGKLAEIAEKFLKKGKQVLVEGKIQYSEYTDEAGVKKTSTSIRCDNFVMLGSRNGGGSDHEEDEPSGSASTPPPSAPSGGGFDDSLPF